MNLSKRTAKLKYYLAKNFSLFQEIEQETHSYNQENEKHNLEFSELHLSLVESRAISLAIAGFILTRYDSSISKSESKFYEVTCEFRKKTGQM